MRDNRFLRFIPLILLAACAEAPAPAPVISCDTFSERAHWLTKHFDPEQARATLLRYPGMACAPATRVVLARRLLRSVTPSGEIARVLIAQGLGEHRLGATTFVNLAAQVEILRLLADTGHLTPAPELDVLAAQVDALIDRGDWLDEMRETESLWDAYIDLTATLVSRSRCVP